MTVRWLSIFWSKCQQQYKPKFQDEGYGLTTLRFPIWIKNNNNNNNNQHYTTDAKQFQQQNQTKGASKWAAKRLRHPLELLRVLWMSLRASMVSIKSSFVTHVVLLLRYCYRIWVIENLDHCWILIFSAILWICFCGVCWNDLILNYGCSNSFDFNRGSGVSWDLNFFVALIRLLDSWIELFVCSLGLKLVDLFFYLYLCLSLGFWARPFPSYVRVCGIYVKLNPTSASRLTCMTFLISCFHVHRRF